MIGNRDRTVRRRAFRSLSSRLLAAVTAIAVPMLFTPAFGEPQSASISGAVFSAGSQLPLADARVHAGNPRTGEIFSSRVTSADGVFRMSTLPPAEYQLAVESGGGLYLVETPVSLEAGQNRNLQLAISPGKSEPADPPEEAEKEEDDDDNGGLTIWSNPATATLILLGAAVILGFLIEDLITDDRLATRSGT